jgi:hypothetical protein
LPTSKEIYTPILAELAEYKISFVEREIELDKSAFVH